MNQKIKDYFDKIADRYDHPFNPRIDQLLDNLDFTNAKRILDLGAGQGVISSRLYERSGAEIIAMDLSKRMCEIAKEHHSNPHIHIVNADFYDYEDDQFDMIICFDAYPHFLNDKEFAKKANQLLRSGGTLAILHDIGRGELNVHHQKTAGNVSRLLKEPALEFAIFQDYFTPLILKEDENSYRIIAKKK